jgi:hypothetical protein
LLAPRSASRKKTERQGGFRPQPYRQLASTLRAHGSDAEARQILIGMAEDRRKWGNLTWPSRFWERILWFTIRNGYQPLRAGLWLGLLWVIGFIAFGTGYQADVMVPSEGSAYQEFAASGRILGQYDPFCALAYSVDLSLPIISFGQKDHWHPIGPVVTTSGAQQASQHSWPYALFGRRVSLVLGDLIGVPRRSPMFCNSIDGCILLWGGF